ncbi:MAG: ankyrin repeat domain-containing protein, partial [Candidatus Aminicenantes bacterium]|nr:ankyrin repeat domain-containing protein [Candidatus Aminicenantes bacterium]
SGLTPLHFAPDEKIAALLIAKGADINARDLGRYTPLHYAARNGNSELVKLLIAKGAYVNARNGLGQTPLRCAEERDNKEMVDLLKKHGAK